MPASPRPGADPAPRLTNEPAPAVAAISVVTRPSKAGCHHAKTARASKAPGSAATSGCSARSQMTPSASASSPSSASLGGPSAARIGHGRAERLELGGHGRSHAPTVVGDDDGGALDPALLRFQGIQVDGGDHVAGGGRWGLDLAGRVRAIPPNRSATRRRGRSSARPAGSWSSASAASSWSIQATISRSDLSWASSSTMASSMPSSPIVSQPEALGQLADDLDALDRVDGQVGLEVEVGIEHVGRVPGAVGHQLQDHGQQVVAPEPRRVRPPAPCPRRSTRCRAPEPAGTRACSPRPGPGDGRSRRVGGPRGSAT